VCFGYLLCEKKIFAVRRETVLFSADTYSVKCEGQSLGGRGQGEVERGGREGGREGEAEKEEGDGGGGGLGRWKCKAIPQVSA
jgi:hypothetical protein